MTPRSAVVLLVLCFFHATAAAHDTEVVIQLQQGKLRGLAVADVASFKGIPFAAPPVGGLRWRPPQPAPGWRGTRDASVFGNVCPQLLSAGYSAEVLGERPMSEDCLYLNVWTGAPHPESRRPVMVWILPGSFKQGDASMPRYDGRALARQGVVVVTFNYRLGMLGQFAHPALRRSQPDEPAGNYAMMDQIAALEWVRDNIPAFGGDPGNVTIFGMSAGGVSVNYHMASPASAGLFHKAISQSSGIRVSNPRHISEDLPGVPSLESEGARIANRLRIAGDDGAVVAGLRNLKIAQILDYQANNVLGTGGSLNPVLDGQIVVGAVGPTFRAAQQHDVPYMTGATSWEGSLLTWATSADPVLGMLGMSAEQARDLYGETDYRILNNKLYVDLFFGSQRYLARHHAAAGYPTFVYFFSRVLENHGEDFPGAAHGAETRYAFKTLDSLKLLGERIGVFGNRVSDSDHRYADIVSGYWVQFAKTGDPNGADRPGWPRASAGNDLLLEFSQTAPVLRRDFRQRRQSFWDAYFDAGKL